MAFKRPVNLYTVLDTFRRVMVVSREVEKKIRLYKLSGKRTSEFLAINLNIRLKHPIKFLIIFVV